MLFQMKIFKLKSTESIKKYKIANSKINRDKNKIYLMINFSIYR